MAGAALRAMAGGLLLFPRRPFLPGGDAYDFVLGFGGGLDVPLSAHVTLTAHVEYAHLSSGQGLGDFNPAFDGVGVGLALGYALAPPTTVTAATVERTATGGRPTWTPDVVVDASAGPAGDALLATGRVRVAERISAHLLALLDGEAGALADTPLGEVGVALQSSSLP